MNTIEKKGLPNEFTEGEVGDIYIDTDTGYRFKCINKISVKTNEGVKVYYTWQPIRENYKQIVNDVETALQKKLALDEPISKDDVISTIQGIDVGAIVRGVIKGAGVTLRDVVDTTSNINEYKYVNNIAINAIDCVNATSVGTGAIQSCISLMSVNMPVTMNVSDRAMQNCISLTSVNMPSVTSVGNGAISNCILLTSVNMPVATSIGSTAMQNCLSLTSVRLGANQVATLSNKNAFTNTPIAKGTGYIYVPDELVEDYKVATNWSVYADQIRPLSEYVEEEE